MQEVFDAAQCFKFILGVRKQKPKGGRPKQKAIFDPGPSAQENFLMGMKAILAAKPDKKHGHGR